MPPPLPPEPRLPARERVRRSVPVPVRLMGPAPSPGWGPAGPREESAWPPVRGVVRSRGLVQQRRRAWERARSAAADPVNCLRPRLAAVPLLAWVLASLEEETMSRSPDS